ncbi:MAG TPA: hypothetical protein VD969_02290 [Symbiobacteriaceae bacterium]|nr:hypothetical protein [Symbiobacteriaceae bacterium]
MKRIVWMFVLTDGTSTTRTYWPDSGFLWAGPGIKMPDSFRRRWKMR